MTTKELFLKTVVDVPDFPSPGITFKDITPVFLNPALCRALVDDLAGLYEGLEIDAIIGMESRGFLLGMPLALKMDVPFVLARKKGKLPRLTFEMTYELEYGTATIEIHRDAITPGMKVLVHDDLLATGGTADAAARLVEMAGAQVCAFSFLVEITALNGRSKIHEYGCPVYTFASV